jgi:8-oxo-dGTP diphosphatase
MSDREYPDKPSVAVGAVVVHEGRVLLVRRGRPPAEGTWAIPGGRVKLGETMRAAAERELMEETAIHVRAKEVACVLDAIVPDDDGRVRFHYAIVDFNADYLSGEPRPGDDAADVRWLTPAQLKNLPVNKSTLALLKQIGFLS